jgi:hypothetical protein
MSFSDSIESSPLAWMLPFKLTADDREPVFVVWAPGTFLGLYIPSVAFWLQVFISVSLQSILSALISIVTYTQIIQKPGSSRYLLGYGVLIPLWIIVPRWQLHLFGVENMVINFCLSGIIPTLNIFHTMEGASEGLWERFRVLLVLCLTLDPINITFSNVQLRSSICSTITIRLYPIFWFSNDFNIWQQVAKICEIHLEMVRMINKKNVYPDSYINRFSPVLFYKV